MGCSESKPEANGGASPLKRLSQRLSTGGSSKAYDAMVAARATKMAKRASDAHDSQTIKYVSQLKAVRGMKPPENMTLPTPNGKTANLPWLHPSRVGVVSLLDQMDELDTPTTVAVDGTVFECYPYFKERMEFGVELLVGKKRARDIELILAKDGSGVGAAIISALAE